MTETNDFLAGLPNGVQWAGPNHPAAEQSGLIHTLALPATASKSTPAPLVVMVHGWQGDERVMWIFRRTVPEHAAVVAPRAPMPYEAGGNVWWRFADRAQLVGYDALWQPKADQFLDALEALDGFLDRLPELYPVARGPVVLMGFSQGAATVGAYALWKPERVRAVACLAGFLAPPPYTPLPPDRLANLPVFMAVGEQDKTVPLAAAHHARDLYTQTGANLTYSEYPTGHKLSAQGMRDLAAWLAEVL